MTSPPQECERLIEITKGNIWSFYCATKISDLLLYCSIQHTAFSQFSRLVYMMGIAVFFFSVQMIKIIPVLTRIFLVSKEKKNQFLTGENVYDWGQVRGSALLIAGSCASSSTAKIS